MTHLYMVRHGEAQCAVEGIIGGMQGDTGLSKLGVQQAERLRDRLQGTKEIKADILIASTLPRARQTAEIISPALGLPLEMDDEIHELRPGESDGMSIKEYRERYGNVWEDGSAFRQMAPGAESWSDFMNRVGCSLERITRKYAGKTIVMVCHGGVIDGSFLYFFGMNTLSLPSIHFHTNNTSVTHWKQREHGPTAGQWEIVHYNDDFHLRDLHSRTRIPWHQLAERDQQQDQPGKDDDQPQDVLDNEE